MNEHAPLQLNDQQSQAIEALLRFLRGPEQCFVLRGSAGTGKTTLIRALVERLEQSGQLFFLIAPTGRAARILAAKTMRRAVTIHSFIYALGELDVNEEAQTANDPGYRLTFHLKTDDPGQCVIIVDEASMVGDAEAHQDLLRFGSGRLLTDLISYARIGRQGARCDDRRKVIFVGDPAQLPPVGESVSPALSRDVLCEQFGLAAVEYELTEVMRHKQGGEILSAATRVRDAIKSKQFNIFSLGADSSEIQAISTSQAVSLVASRWGGDKGADAVITYSNRQALEINRSVRSKLWGCEDVAIQPGDILLVNKNSFRYGLSNGDLVRVVDTDAHAMTRDVRMRGGDSPVRLVFRDATLAFRDIDGTVTSGKCMLLENLLGSRERDLAPNEHRALLVDFRNRHPDLKPGSAEFGLMIRDDLQFNALQVKYGYAVTCHKAQGGEWDTVAVDFSDSRGRRNEEFFRWSYTAITRARSQLLTISAPEFDQYSDLVWGRMGDDEAGSHGTESPIRTSDETVAWERFSFRPGEEALFAQFKRINSALTAIGVDILDLEHLQFCERYTLARGAERARIQYWYKGSQKVSRIANVSRASESTELGDELTAIFSKALSDDEANGNVQEAKFITEFKKRLMESLETSGIRFISSQSMPYRFRVELEENGRRMRIDFLYDSTPKWTRVREVGTEGSIRGVVGRLQALMQQIHV